MKKDFDIASAEEKIGARFRSLRRSVNDPGVIKINKENKKAERRTSPALQLAGAFLAAVIVGGGTFAALKMMERYGAGSAGVSDTTEEGDAIVKAETGSVLIDLNAYPPPSEDGAAKTFTLFSNNKITVTVEEDGRCYAMPKDSLNEVMFDPGAWEKAECYAVWVDSCNGIKDTLLFVDRLDEDETLYALGADGACVKVTDTVKLSMEFGGVEQRNIFPGLSADGSPMFSYRAVMNKRTCGGTWDVRHDFSVVCENGQLTATHILDEEEIKNAPREPMYMSFTAYGQTVRLNSYMVGGTSSENGVFIDYDGGGHILHDRSEFPVIYAECGEDPGIVLELFNERFPGTLSCYVIDDVGNMDNFSFKPERDLSQYRGSELLLVYVLRVDYTSPEISMKAEYEFPVVISYVHSSVPFDEQIVIKRAEHFGRIVISRIACEPHFTVRGLIDNAYPKYGDEAKSANDDAALLQALYNACQGKDTPLGVPRCDPDYEITLSVDGEEYYVFKYKMRNSLTCENGVIIIYTAGCVEYVGSVTLTEEDDYAISLALGLTDG